MMRNQDGILSKDKATQLVQKYYDEVSAHMQWSEAQQCVLIMVDEILKLIAHTEDA